MFHNQHTTAVAGGEICGQIHIPNVQGVTDSGRSQVDLIDRFSALFVPLRCKKRPFAPQRNEERREQSANENKKQPGFVVELKSFAFCSPNRTSLCVPSTIVQLQ